jgi:D-glycero-D-manno-heptose 1,7-bisphosphate phosphatase
MKPLIPRQLPNPAPERIDFNSQMVIKKLRQSEDMVLYINYIDDKPTFIFLMAQFNPDTALTLTGFLDNRCALVVSDRDGVVKDSTFLNDTDKQDAANVMIPSALEAGKKLNDAGVGLAIATNQGGFQSGKMSFEDTIAINVRVSQQMANAGGHLDAIFICPFAESLKCTDPEIYDARKPSGGMPLFARQLAAASEVPVLAMVGDQRTDGAAGQAAGLKFFAVTDNHGRWKAELESAICNNKSLPILDTGASVYQEVPAFADAVRILLA